MITLKYKKTGDATFVSHIDTLRYLSRAMRRTGFDVEYSKGFNPHMMLNLSAPLAMGVSSCAEYVTIGLNGVDVNTFMDVYNKVTTPNLAGIKAWSTEKNPNIAGVCSASVYEYTPNDAYKFEGVVAQILNSEQFVISYTQKGAEVNKDVRDMIKSISLENGVLRMILASGNTNLRADRFMTNVCKIAGEEMMLSRIIRVAQLMDVGGKQVNVDSYLNTLSTPV